jgi:biuret amidohydrolase
MRPRAIFAEFKRATVETIRARGPIVGWTATVDQIAAALK